MFLLDSLLNCSSLHLISFTRFVVRFKAYNLVKLLALCKCKILCGNLTFDFDYTDRTSKQIRQFFLVTVCNSSASTKRITIFSDINCLRKGITLGLVRMGVLFIQSSHVSTQLAPCTYPHRSIIHR